MSGPALLFLFANLTIVAGYAFAAGLIVARKGPAEHMGRVAWSAGLAFFVTCGLTHATMAYETITGDPMLHDPRSPSEWMLTVHVPQAAAIWAFLWAMNIRTHNGGPPLEGQATVTDEFDDHP